MKFYTSYYYQIRNFPPNLIALSTAIWPPKYLNFGIPDKRGVICINCPPLQPGISCEGLCDGSCDPKHPKDCSFLKVYREQLDKIDFNNFIKSLDKISKIFLNDYPNFETVNFAFIVYEKFDNPCSERGPIQDWLRANGIEVEEWHL